MDDLRLIIDGAKQEDRGDYECIAENMAGVKKGTVKLYVSRKIYSFLLLMLFVNRIFYGFFLFLRSSRN